MLIFLTDTYLYFYEVLKSFSAWDFFRCTTELFVRSHWKTPKFVAELNSQFYSKNWIISYVLLISSAKLVSSLSLFIN